jgi:hypothetical protein
MTTEMNISTEKLYSIPEIKYFVTFVTIQNERDL